MSATPEGRDKTNIWGEAPATTEEERSWPAPETFGEEHCADRTREIQKECEQEEIQARPLKNKESRENDADGEWHLFIGGRAWGIWGMEMKTWEATAYERLWRGETPEGGLWIEKVQFLTARLVYFDDRDKDFSPKNGW